MSSQRESENGRPSRPIDPEYIGGTNQREDLFGLLLTILAGLVIVGISAVMWLSIGSLSRLL